MATRSRALLHDLIDFTAIPMSCWRLQSIWRFFKFAKVVSLKEAFFKALFIFVLKAAISLQPLAKAPELKKEAMKTDDINFFINLPLIYFPVEIGLFLRKPSQKKYFQYVEAK